MTLSSAGRYLFLTNSQNPAGKTNMKPLILINYVDRAHGTNLVIQNIEDMFRETASEYKIVKFKDREESVRAVSQGKEDGFDTLFIGGGDGTVFHIFNMAFGMGFTFGIIPLGTVNAMSRSLGFAKNSVKACRQSLNGKAKRIDVGRAAGHWFTCFASIGYDASVVHTINEKSKIRWKQAAFGIHGVKRLFHLHEISPIEVVYESDGEKLSGYSFIMSNLHLYGGFRLFGDRIDDGEMDSALIRRNGPLDYLRTPFKLYKTSEKERYSDNLIHRRKTSEVIVKGKAPLYLQLDGDPVSIPPPATEVKLEVKKQAARFLIP